MRSSLFPLRTCFIGFSPSSSERSNRNHGTTARVGFLLPFFVVTGERKKRGISAFCLFFYSPLFIWRETERFNWCFGCWHDAGRILDRDGLICCQGFFFSPNRSTDWMKWIQQPHWSEPAEARCLVYLFLFPPTCRRWWMNGETRRSAVSNEATFLISWSQSAAHTLWFGWNVFVVMRLPSVPTDITLDFPFRIRAFPEWLDSLKICPPAMEAAQAAEGEAADRVPGEGEPGVAAPLRVARGFTSSRWRREPGQWPFTTRIPSNRTASPSTAPSSSSARTISSGSTQNE